ncbi:hypothetical protein P6166_06430 [Stenotrophomonas sp. HITSZ_GD]|jgi:hypothetical protein|uniref:hypothetical protein n=1 Tax=Stenotrophomonas sp. HITSZ_GD TaxID=3037248 RepID=UPI00240D3117|nr:hypothetical protein [Stenotrophomonas sp. HITSZ_GD]MDG2524988.1 hypothetical protein [Stenotrophomonas sp. HITSZ_GD]
MRPRHSSQTNARAARESAGTGVAHAWWQSLHPGAWCVLVALVLALAWWLWH